MSKYSVMQIAKTLDKMFTAGFNTEKKIMAIQIEDLQLLPDITSVEMNIIIELKRAIKSKKIIAFLSGCDE